MFDSPYNPAVFWNNATLMAQWEKENQEQIQKITDWHPNPIYTPDTLETPTTTTNRIPGNTYTEEIIASGGKSITNTQFSNTVISGTDYADYIYSSMNKVTVYGGAGSDTLNGYGTGTELYSGVGNDSIYGGDILAVGGAGDDTISGSDSTIYGGEGKDSILGYGSTINAGAGDDTVKVGSVGKYSVIQYSLGDGNDLIQGFDSARTYGLANKLIIYGSYTTQESGDNVLVHVGSGTITLEGVNGQTLDIETSNVAFPTPAGNLSISTPQTVNTDSPALTNSPNGIPKFNFGTTYNYAGGDQVISDYQSGEKITLGTTPTGYIFGGGNFALSSATGNLFIANANDKVINFVDSAGNPVLKAYAATNPGILDGRGIAGYEYIVGSDAGTDVIYAGDGGSQLWGGAGIGADALVGGAGADMFIGGKYQGADTFMNASSADVVFLNDTTLSDIVAAGEMNGTIALAFNTGNVVAVQSSEALSAAFVLADGSAWRFNHATKSWQSA